MLQQHPYKSGNYACRDGATFEVSLARDQGEVREAQRLRYKVFAEEMGARLTGREAGIDSDLYDPWCEHLIVRETQSGRVVGTYRMLSGANARRLGGFYSDEEFDLTRLETLRDQIVEVGRSCVHRNYRHGAVISMLWGGVAQHVAQQGYRYLMGCASIGMADGGYTAASVHDTLLRRCASPVEYREFPRLDLPLRPVRLQGNVVIPPLIKGYVRLGAYMCGAPAWDPDFNTADLLMLLPMSRLPTRYSRRFYVRNQVHRRHDSADTEAM